MHEQTTEGILLRARQQINELEDATDDESLVGMFKRAAIHAIDSHTRLVSGVNSLVIKQDDQEQDLCKFIKIFNICLIKFQ
jgi:hypothetical protein